MPRKSNTRAPQGVGSIRKRKDGTYEGRYTIGRDPGTGKQIQRSVYAKTEAEAVKKLRALAVQASEGVYTPPSKMKLGQWLDIWLEEYTGGIKELTRAAYENQVRLHIKPALGAVKLPEVKSHQIQAFYNMLQKEKGLSPKTIKNINGVFHRAMDQAMLLGYIRANPCNAVILPRVNSPEMRPLEEEEMDAFLGAVRGSEYESIFKVTLFTGMRQGEAMGLTWDRVNFDDGTILIDRQMIHEHKKGGVYKFSTPKNSRSRMLSPAPSVMRMLRERKRQQAEQKLQAGSAWNDMGFPGLVFTNPLGGLYSNSALLKNTVRIGQQIGIERLRFHDLRHSYAVASIRAGDDIKTISSNLGHATVAFTLDKYAHYTKNMRRDSSERMEAFMANMKNL